MKRSDLGLMALGGLAVASGCAPQSRASFDPPAGPSAAEAPAATSGPKISVMQLHEVTVGTVLGFLVYHDRTTPITVTANPSDMTEIKTVDKHANATHISIKVIANGSSLVQVLSSDQEFIAFYISTHA